MAAVFAEKESSVALAGRELLPAALLKSDARQTQDGLQK
jgi:hypothetical protein